MFSFQANPSEEKLTADRLGNLQGFAHIESQAKNHSKYFDYSTNSWRSVCFLERIFRYIFAAYCDSTCEKCIRISMAALRETYLVAEKLGASLNGYQVRYFNFIETLEYQKNFFLKHTKHNIKATPTYKTPTSEAIVAYIRECTALSNSLQNTLQRTVYVTEQKTSNKCIFGPREYAPFIQMFSKSSSSSTTSKINEGICFLLFRGKKTPYLFKQGVKAGHIRQFLAWTFKIPFDSLILNCNGLKLTDNYFLPVRLVLNSRQ